MILDPMKVTLSDSEITNIKEIIERKDKCKTEVAPSFNTIWFRNRTAEFETELRLLCLGNLKLTISRVCFKNRRCGTMSEILEKLEQICKEKNIQKIVFQSVETNEMSNFCLKHGYMPNLTCSFEIDGMIFGDYEKEII